MPVGRGVAVGPDANFITGRNVRYQSPYGEDLTDLRRQQADFAKERRAEADHNAWMAIPALAPAVAVLGLEGAAALVARLATKTVINPGPLVFRPSGAIPWRRRQASEPMELFGRRSSQSRVGTMS